MTEPNQAEAKAKKIVKERRKEPEAYSFSNLTNGQEACLALLESLSIYELRSVVRIFGLKTASTTSRKEIIEFLMKIIISGEDLRPEVSHKGRPYKMLTNTESVLSQISQMVGKDYTLTSADTLANWSSRQKVVNFNQVEDEVYSKHMFPISVAGTICETEKRLKYLLDEQTGQVVYVPRDLNLSTHDHVQGTAVLMNSKNEYVLEDVETINFKDAQLFANVLRPYDENALPNEALQFNKNTITLGKRYLFPNVMDNLAPLKDLLKTLKRNGVISIALFANTMKDEIPQLNEVGFDALYIAKYDDTPFKIHEIFENFAPMVKRLQDLGCKLAIFVNNVSVLADASDYMFQSTTKLSMGHAEITVASIKEMVGLAKAGGKGKSTTLFTSFDETDLFDTLFVNSIYKVSKKLQLD